MIGALFVRIVLLVSRLQSHLAEATRNLHFLALISIRWRVLQGPAEFSPHDAIFRLALVLRDNVNITVKSISSLVRCGTPSDLPSLSLEPVCDGTRPRHLPLLLLFSVGQGWLDLSASIIQVAVRAKHAGEER